MSEKLEQKKAQYVLNRVDILRKLKEHREVIDKIVMEGIETDHERHVARIACTLIASEYCYDDAVMNDKTGGNEDIF